MTVHIDDRMDRFLTEQLTALTDSPIQPPYANDIESRCPHCKEMVRRPVIARSRDVQAFEGLLAIAEKYLDGQGVREKMLAAIKVDIRAGLRANATVREIIKAAKTAGEP